MNIAVVLAASIFGITGTFQPRQMPNGERLWTYVIAKTNIEEDLLIRVIANELGNNKFCPGGWEILSREIPMKGFLSIEGRCK